MVKGDTGTVRPSERPMMRSRDSILSNVLLLSYHQYRGL